MSSSTIGQIYFCAYYVQFFDYLIVLPLLQQNQAIVVDQCIFGVFVVVLSPCHSACTPAAFFFFLPASLEKTTINSFCCDLNCLIHRETIKHTYIYLPYQASRPSSSLVFGMSLLGDDFPPLFFFSISHIFNLRNFENCGVR